MTARDFQVLLVSGYARRYIRKQQQNGQRNNNNKITFNIIKACVMFYNGFSFHVEIPFDSFPIKEDECESKCHPLSWSNCDGTTFDVRRGPNYVDGQKAKSKPAIYTIFKLEGYKTPFKMHQIWKYLHSDFDESFKAEISQFGLTNNKQYPLPPILFINIMIPNYAPKMGKNGKKDGSGYQKLIIGHLSASTFKKLDKYCNGKGKKKLPLSPSIKLLSNFILNDSKKVSKVRERFKIIARIMNGKYSKFGFLANKMINNYNAKPFLAKTSTKYYYEPGKYFGIDIDIHSFSYAAKKGLNLVKDTIATAIYDVGFVIEGQLNHELPEQMLASARVTKLGLEDLCKDISSDIQKKYQNDYNK